MSSVLKSDLIGLYHGVEGQSRGIDSVHVTRSTQLKQRRHRVKQASWKHVVLHCFRLKDGHNDRETLG